jgi:hypothetical protein
MNQQTINVNDRQNIGILWSLGGREFRLKGSFESGSEKLENSRDALAAPND